MKELNIGDKIKVKNWMNNYIVEIVRVTKTQAIAKTPYNNEIKFKRSYSHSDYITKLPREKWNTTDYILL